MPCRRLGRTNFEIGILGFGAMRLPMLPAGAGDGAAPRVDEEQALAMFHRAFERGVNYVDTAYMYCGGQSETVVGRALKGWWPRVRVSTKLPMGEVKCRDDFRRLLEAQLRRLDLPRVDVYHFHGLSAQRWREQVLGFGLLDEMARARAEGLVGHAAFSFHDKPEAMRPMLESGAFDVLLCQYNLLDRANAAMMAEARRLGLGVIAMGPVAGGRLGSPREYLETAVAGRARTPEIALRFVWANPDVSCALSGMSDLRQVEENTVAAAEAAPLTDAERAEIERVLESRRRLAELYCTGCGYCMPCPHGVNIPICFEAQIAHTVYGFTEHAMRRYRAIGDRWLGGKRADACTGCGVCESKCPQQIPIRRQLAEVARTLNPLL